MPNPSKAPQNTAYRPQHNGSTLSKCTSHLQVKYNSKNGNRQVVILKIALFFSRFYNQF